MPSRRSIIRCAAVSLVVWVLAGCSDEPDESAAAGDARAEQARAAALDAGLDEDVADFLGLVARGDTATYRVRYPGPVEGTELVVVNRPPDRRVEVVAGDVAVEVRLVTGGQAFECLPEEGEGAGAADPALTCRRTDAVVEPPGVFRADALDDLRDALATRVDDYTFSIETQAVAGIEAQCMITRLRSGREGAELGSSGTICASPEGALVLVDQGDQRLEAIDYGTDVTDDAFIRPDHAGDGPEA